MTENEIVAVMLVILVFAIAGYIRT